MAEVHPNSPPDLTIDALWNLIGRERSGVLATIKRDGRPQLSNISYRWDAELKIARTAAATFRSKSRNLARDPRASLHVTNSDFSLWVVAEGIVELSPPSSNLGDDIARELFEIAGVDVDNVTSEELAAHAARYPIVDRQVIRIHVNRIYGGNASAALGIASE
jgi:PPOX class probable F420-dependent enzyme